MQLHGFRHVLLDKFTIPCYIRPTKQFDTIFLVDFHMEIITQEKSFVKRLSNKKEVPLMGKINKLTQKDKVLYHLKKMAL